MWHIHANEPEDALRERAAYLAALARECGDASFDRFTAQLIYTELVGNVIRHAKGPIDVQLRCVDGKALLHVFDRGHGFVLKPHLPRASLQENGRGLFLVSQFAERVNVHTLEGHGTCVSAVFSIGRHAQTG
ncbi:MAG TPA: ATP-binding protein [Candidatus Aquilonibacter sp.]|nr:ATP-binding protein [Candidatus Aquilonibacter sp.]